MGGETVLFSLPPHQEKKIYCICDLFAGEHMDLCPDRNCLSETPEPHSKARPLPAVKLKTMLTTSLDFSAPHRHTSSGYKPGLLAGAKRPRVPVRTFRREWGDDYSRNCNPNWGKGGQCQMGMFELYDSFAFFRVEKIIGQQIGCDNKLKKRI